MVLLDNEKFLAMLPDLFADTKEKGSVNLSIKRYDYTQGKKRKTTQNSEEEAMRQMVDKLSLDDKEYATLVRAATEKKKLSTLVAPGDLDSFLAHYHGVFLACVASMKKNERARKKKLAVKKATSAKRLKMKMKARAAAAKEQQQQQES
ncbi:signal recognition particle, SRP9/SRP14 subunit [Linderina pennispora]|uniref:Signal recognition particle subunit SRP14 n=1 Tax=Linderina pennispora TaxID=61395 RepID=A0A1Y1W875_9FUNG|nr:signal recognition particle, SRP9/SRP14 subunit [Linderina pennispora]ORX69727.1 signal recognition particle, SRP9/SRP14 subunit [Linderina pennispora]